MGELARIEAADGEGVRVVRVSGEIDLSNAREVFDTIGANLPADTACLVIDLSETTYLDSSGIAMVFRLVDKLKCSRQQLRLVVPPDAPIRAVVDLTKLSAVVPVDDAHASPSSEH